MSAMSTGDVISAGPRGYADPGYAEALSEFGSPRHLPRSEGWLLERPVSGLEARDAMGCYPLFSCLDWSGLADDLADLDGKLVSVALVADPFGDHTEGDLRRAFPDKLVPFKEHFVVDLSGWAPSLIHPHHRRNASKAERAVDVEVLTEPRQLLDEWQRLYENLVERHRIRGIAAFSRQSFGRQLAIRGTLAFRAVLEEETVGMVLWVTRPGIGYYHLGAYSDRGYEVESSFALFLHAISHFAAQGLRWLDLGAGPGLTGGGSDGLSRFKRGWSTGTRTAYLGGRILSPALYAEAVRLAGEPATDYFPAYRAEPAPPTGESRSS